MPRLTRSSVGVFLMNGFEKFHGDLPVRVVDPDELLELFAVGVAGFQYALDPVLVREVCRRVSPVGEHVHMIDRLDLAEQASKRVHVVTDVLELEAVGVDEQVVVGADGPLDVVLSLGDALLDELLGRAPPTKSYTSSTIRWWSGSTS